MDTVYVRFVRKIGKRWELVGGMQLPLGTLPRQGDWIEVRWSDDRTTGTVVQSIRLFYAEVAEDRDLHASLGKLEFVEVQVA